MVEINIEPIKCLSDTQLLKKYGHAHSEKLSSDLINRSTYGRVKMERAPYRSSKHKFSMLTVISTDVGGSLALSIAQASCIPHLLDMKSIKYPSEKYVTVHSFGLSVEKYFGRGTEVTIRFTLVFITKENRDVFGSIGRELQCAATWFWE